MFQFLATVIPSLVLVYFFVSLDKFPEPKKIIISTFILGIVIAIPAGFLNTYAIIYITENYPTALFLRVLIPGPVIEEILKLAVLLLFCARREAFDEPMDGLVYGATAALGFAMIENFGYVYNAEYYNTTWAYIAWIRAILTAPMHACCGIILGFSVSYYYFYKKNFVFILLGLVIAILFHFAFNYGYSSSVVILQLILIFILFKNLRKRQILLKEYTSKMLD
tara:strand:- start:7 stop:675 length:669 start_codon:yes stop_codon:yes gene_type:complete